MYQALLFPSYDQPEAKCGHGPLELVVTLWITDHQPPGKPIDYYAYPGLQITQEKPHYVSNFNGETTRIWWGTVSFWCKAGALSVQQNSLPQDSVTLAG